MGVWGLLGFLKKNTAALSHKSELTNTSLVIDATNLTCKLFNLICEDPDSRHWRCDIYGGDLVGYGEAVRELLTNLDKCGITPILVFDGAMGDEQETLSDEEDELVSEEMKAPARFLNQFQVAKQMEEEKPEKTTLMSKCLSQIFMNIAHEYKRAIFIQAPYGSNPLIARIANERDCYVMSDDSYFILCPLPKGFIMIDYESFDYKNLITTENGQHHIGCIVYSQDKLFRCFPGLTPDSLRLLNCLVPDCDFTEESRRNNFVRKIWAPIKLPIVARNPNHQRIAIILMWLRNKTPEESMRHILNHAGVRIADDEEPCLPPREIYDFEEELAEIYPASRVDPFVPQYICPKILPSVYLRRLFETADLGPIALGMVFKRMHYFNQSIDDFELESSGCVRYRPISLAITLLRPSCSSLEREYKIYDRVDGDYRQIILKGMKHLDGFGSLEHLNCYSMIQLEPEQKKSLLMHTFRFNDDELNQMTDTLSRVFESQFLNEARTCFLLVKYIALETKCDPKPQFVDALVLTLFYYAALNDQLKMDSIVRTNKEQLLLLLEPHSITNNGIYYEPSQRVYRRIMHFISQLEAAYFAYCFLNTLLDRVFELPRYERFLNRTLVFRLTKLLYYGNLETTTLCNEMPALQEACASIKVMVHYDE